MAQYQPTQALRSPWTFAAAVAAEQYRILCGTGEGKLACEGTVFGTEKKDRALGLQQRKINISTN